MTQDTLLCLYILIGLGVAIALANEAKDLTTGILVILLGALWPMTLASLIVNKLKG